MVSDPERLLDEGKSEKDPQAESDGGISPGFDDAALYSVVRTAVKDALLDVIGTVLLVGIGFVLVAAGGQAVIQASSLPRLTIGVWLVAIGIYLAATALELIPSIQDWF